MYSDRATAERGYTDFFQSEKETPMPKHDSGHWGWYHGADVANTCQNRPDRGCSGADQLIGPWWAMCFGSEGSPHVQLYKSRTFFQPSEGRARGLPPRAPRRPLPGRTERRQGCSAAWDVRLKQMSGGVEATGAQCQSQGALEIQSFQGRWGPYSLGSFSTCRATDPAS